MKALTQTRYGGPEVLALSEVSVPTVGPDGVLVRVRAASLNPVDWHFMRGEPYVLRLSQGLRRPRQSIRGIDVAGVVEAVGAYVKDYVAGDEVFGFCQGGLAEFACGYEADLVSKPPGLSFEQAAALPLAGATALQALSDYGRLEPDDRLLINGAAGGVGTMALQIARASGAHVIAVCSTGNIELVEALGADEVIDYTREDFSRRVRGCDLVIDAVGNRSLSDLRRVLKPDGTVVLLGGGHGRLLGPLAQMGAAALLGRFGAQKLRSFLAKRRKEDLLRLRHLAEAGQITPVIDRVYTLSEAAEAIRYLEAGHARGKVVVSP